MIVIKITNRVMYSFLAIVLVVLVAFGVYAVTPNPGYSASQIDFTAESVPSSAISFASDSVPLSAIDTDLCQTTGDDCDFLEEGEYFIEVLEQTGPGVNTIWTRSCTASNDGQIVYYRQMTSSGTSGYAGHLLVCSEIAANPSYYDWRALEFAS